jgi:HD-like signal output (HDOD) protein
MTALTSSAPPLRNKYATFLIRYLPGTGRDLPIVSPRARGLRGRSQAAPLADAELAEAYSTDPFLAAKLCGVANSIFFNLDHAQLTSISGALNMLRSSSPLQTCRALLSPRAMSSSIGHIA